MKKIRDPSSNGITPTDVVLKVSAFFNFYMVEEGDYIFWQIIN